MSQVLINKYLTELATLRKVGGTHRESVVSEAFKDLLKGWGRTFDLTFIPQYQFETKAGDRRIVDGALLHTLRVPFGYWEAKDSQDDLDSEITKKFKADYRLGNRSALEWVLDQHKEKTPKDPTIRERFNTYRFADYKDKVIDLLGRVTTVSVQTVAIVEAMRRAPR